MDDNFRALPVRTAGSTSRPSTGLGWIAWAPAALAVQLLLINLADRLPGGTDLLPVLLVAAHLALVPFLLRNLSFWGARLMLVGLALNLAVMLANGGLMPVESSAVDSVGRRDSATLAEGEHVPGTKNVFLEHDDVRLGELSDVIVLPLPRPFTSAVSAGDLLVFPGALLVIAEIALRSKRSRAVVATRSQAVL